MQVDYLNIVEEQVREAGRKPPGENGEDKNYQESKKKITAADYSFPSVMCGAAGHFAKEYSNISEAPIHFYYLAYLACLGSYLSGKVSLDTLLDVQTRLYILFLGPSGRGRKSTPILVTTQFFQELLEDFSIMHHANSGEGLGVYLEKHPRTLLVYDEFLAFVSKAIQKGGTLLGAVTSLFEKNAYQTATKDKQLVIENAHLSMLAACTTDTWERCWERDFTAIGLNNRLFLAYGKMETLVSIPPRLNQNVWQELRDETRDRIRHALSVKEFSLTSDAYGLYDYWYKNELNHKSLHSVRLDQYALRLMILFAINELKSKIDEEIVVRVISLIEWEHFMRQQLDPIDADNEMAKVEARIQRVLLTGEKTYRELQQGTGTSKSGLWIWKTALSNLIEDRVAYKDEKSKRYGLLAST